MYKLVYLESAKNDLDNIFDYIIDELKAPGAAADLFSEMMKQIELLSQFPYAHALYHAIGPLRDEVRCLPVKKYLIFYVVVENAIVEIRRIIYNKRNTKNDLGTEKTADLIHEDAVLYGKGE